MGRAGSDMGRRRIIEVVAGVMWRGGRFLAVRRPPGTSMAGYWEFPGGKIEPGETPAEALVRELDEELGVRVHGLEYWRELVHDYPHAKVQLYFFHVRGIDGEPHPREGQELSWLTPGGECDLTFLPADEDILADLMRPDGPDSDDPEGEPACASAN